MEPFIWKNSKDFSGNPSTFLKKNLEVVNKTSAPDQFKNNIFIESRFLKQVIISPTTKDFYTKHKISQNEGVLRANMQNEKQSTFFKVHEKFKNLRKKLDEQTKGTH